MATKPVDNIAEWADGSNSGNYVGGPYAGQPRKVSIPNGIAAEGFRPGADDPTAAEHINDWLNRAALKLRWVHAGTASPVAEATIVERSSTGRISAQSGYFRSDLVANTATLTAIAPESAGSALLVFASKPGTNADPLIEMVHENDGPGIEFMGGAFCDAFCVGDMLTGLRLETAGDGASGIDVITAGIASDGVSAVASGANCHAVIGTVNHASSIGVQGFAQSNGTGGAFYGGSVSGVGCLVDATGDNGLVATGGNSPTTAAVKATGKATAPGVIATGGPTAGAAGVVASGGAGGGEGVRATGTGAAAGVLAVGGTGAAGVDALGEVGVDCLTTSVSGSALRAISHAAATTGSAIYAIGQAAGDGVVVLATGSGTGFRANTGSGPAADLTASGAANAARFDAAGTKPTTVHVARASDPTVHEDGGIWYRDNIGLSTRREGHTRRVCDTAGGMVCASAWNNVGGTVNDSTLNTILTLSLTGANAPAVVGTVLIRVAVEVGRNSGTPNCTLEVWDDTAPVNVAGFLNPVALYQAAGVGVFERHLLFEVPWLLPAAGARTFSVRLFSSTPAALINWRNAGASVLGVF